MSSLIACPDESSLHKRKHHHLIPISRLTYAIGDIHEESDLLSHLLNAVSKDAADRGAEPRIIFLGDVVDRSPDTRGALDLIVATLRKWPGSSMILGNHDDWFLHAIGEDAPNPAIVQHWWRHGGREAIGSYGLVLDDDDFLLVRGSIRRDHPDHLAVLISASLMELDDGYAFVHAGIDPARPMDAQERRNCLTIRGPFLDHAGPLSHIIVQGHSVTKSGLPEVYPHRIAVDTGPMVNGRLTAAVLDPFADNIEFIVAEWQNEQVIVTSLGEDDVRPGSRAHAP